MLIASTTMQVFLLIKICKSWKKSEIFFIFYFGLSRIIAPANKNFNEKIKIDKTN